LSPKVQKGKTKRRLETQKRRFDDTFDDDDKEYTNGRRALDRNPLRFREQQHVVVANARFSQLPVRMDPGFNGETVRKTNPSERFRVDKIRRRRREETQAEIQRGELESHDGEFEEV